MSKLFEKLLRPLLFKLDPERAHELGIEALKLGAGSIFGARHDENILEVERFGLKFANPLGIAAGFDKNGVVVNQLAGLGFGFVEVGTVTLEPQPGNEKPRLFRLPDDRALINRLGFNNQGAKTIAGRLEKMSRKCVLGVNIGKNKDVPNEEAVENYFRCFEVVRDVADYIAVNVSSPNTPNLRELQKTENLEDLLTAIQRQNERDPVGGAPKPLLVKIAPDLSEAEIEGIADVCIRLKVAGIIATNTTIGRGGLRTPDLEKFGGGGLSGRPLSNRSTEVILQIYRYSNGKLPIVGVGGIFAAADAFEKIAAGASLLQAYTGFVYGGPSFASDVNAGLAKILRERGFPSLDEAVGSAVK
ncbi:MAG: quinone-dependent dihydroorotate dehydrogenase [Acidobacteriota bacterium]